MKKRFYYRLLLLGLPLLFYFLPVCSEYALRCQYTGAAKGYTKFWFGPETDTWYEPSKFEGFIKSHFAAEHKNRWTVEKEETRNIFGTDLSHTFNNTAMSWVYGEMMQANFDEFTTAKKKELYDLLVSRDIEKVETYFSRLESIR
jgi:hypothetical protein